MSPRKSGPKEIPVERAVGSDGTLFRGGRSSLAFDVIGGGGVSAMVSGLWLRQLNVELLRCWSWNGVKTWYDENESQEKG